jgi:hypothetical protein
MNGDRLEQSGLDRAWNEASAALPRGWELRGVAKGPREMDPRIRDDSWVAWARPDREEGHRADLPPIVEGKGESADQALRALARELRKVPRPISGPLGSANRSQLVR